MAKPRVVKKNTIIKIASMMINLINDYSSELDVASWIKHDRVDYLPKCYKSNQITLLHDYILYQYVCMENYFIGHDGAKEELIEMIDILENQNHLDLDLSKFKKVNFDDLEYDEIEELAEELQDIFFDKGLDLLVDDVFNELFSNKEFLKEFNLQLSTLIKDCKKTDYPEYLKKDGVLKRVPLPKWLLDGVSFRDKQICQLCGADLTQVLRNDIKKNIDHIIPLEQSGSNDPTNFQLLCESCNKSKSDKNNNYNDVIHPVW